MTATSRGTMTPHVEVLILSCSTHQETKQSIKRLPMKPRLIALEFLERPRALLE
jgi:hypothetical protein